MSTLNSLVRLVLAKEKLPLGALVETGLDVELLQELLGEFRPHMDYLGGRPLEDQYPVSLDLSKYAAAVINSGISDWRCVNVFAQHSALDPANRIAVFLNRRGQWIVWISHPRNKCDRFVVEARIPQMLKLVNETIGPEDFDLKSPALSIIERLTTVFQVSIDRKLRAAKVEQEKLTRFTDKLNLFS